MNFLQNTQDNQEEHQSARLDCFAAIFHSVADLAETREADAKSHLERVSVYTRFIAEQLGLTSIQQRRLEVAALLHDVGKNTIARGELWLRPGSFTRDEHRYIQKHTVRGHAFIVDMEQRFRSTTLYDKTLFLYAREVSRHHHENYDGSGYPDRLVGDLIPLSARIVKLVDVIDALLSQRPYKPAWPWERVKAELVGTAANEFDPSLLQLLMEHETQFVALVEEGKNSETMGEV